MRNLFYKILFKIQKKIQKILGYVTVGVRAIVLNDKHEVLLVRHTYIPGWYMPGGGVDRHEDPIMAITRELWEEVGVKPKKVPELFGIYHNLFQGVDDYPIVYVIRHFSQEYVISSEIAEISWFSLDALPDDTSPGTRRRLAEFKTHTLPSRCW